MGLCVEIFCGFVFDELYVNWQQYVTSGCASQNKVIYSLTLRRMSTNSNNNGLSYLNTSFIKHYVKHFHELPHLILIEQWAYCSKCEYEKRV